LIERLYNIDDVVAVGQTLAIIETDGENNEIEEIIPEVKLEEKESAVEQIEESFQAVQDNIPPIENSPSGKFYSPLVKTIAKKEKLSMDELEAVVGTGKDNRVTKNDILAYLQNRGTHSIENEISEIHTAPSKEAGHSITSTKVTPVVIHDSDEIIEMTRMGKIVASHMIASVQTSAHVQSFIEVDVTKLVNWRNRIKDQFYNREDEKLTFTPIFMEAIAKAIKDFPMMNISVDGDKIIKRKNINLGMATALDDGNLIVPVIKNADQLNLVGMTKAVNNLAKRARNNDLKPDDIQGGTYTVTNVGSFGSIMGTPIINQPQVGILALGAIRKMPSVIETSEGDFIGIRHKMFLSHSYDHRVVNGALGGMFVKRVAEYLEDFDVKREF
jgi:2-oxoglutarate dehydrogenase E2 component (dihydrolipoamide succinyltransferase)